MKFASAFFLTSALCFTTLQQAEALTFRDSFGPRFSSGRSIATSQSPKKALDSIHRWNTIAINASGLDHTPVASGELRPFGEQLGPGRSSRAMAIVHIAIFDSVNAVLGGYQSYSGIPRVKSPASLDAAVAQAAHDTLAALYPSQAAKFDSLLADDLAKIRNKNERAQGVSLGRRAAIEILELRANDGSQLSEPRVGVSYFTSDQAGHWRQDPISLIPLALGAHWGECKTFVVQSGSQFRAPSPPAMNSAEYTAAYNEVKSLGGDGVTTSTVRTPEQSFIGIFWAYDGTPSLCAPPRLYNQIAVHIANQMHLGAVDLARLLALTNTAMADAGMAIWDSKYYMIFGDRSAASENQISGPAQLDSAMETHRPSATSPLRQWARRRVISPVRISLPHFPLILPATPDLAARFSKPCEDFSAPTTSRSPLSPTNSTA